MMKHKSFILFTICLAVAVSVVFSAGSVWAGTNTPAVPAVKIQKPLKLEMKSDPSPVGIYSYACDCQESVERAGGILFKGVIVELKNKKCPGLPNYSPVSGKVRLTWFDVKEKRNKSITQDFRNLNRGQSVVVIPSSTNILAAKNSYVTAEIIQLSGAKDCNTANNKIKTNTCSLERVN